MSPVSLSLKQMRGNPSSFDSQGLQQPMIDPVMLISALMGPSLIKSLLSVYRGSPEILGNEMGSVFPKRPMPNPFQYEEQGTAPRWLTREFGKNLPNVSKPSNWDIYQGKIIGSGSTGNDRILTTLMNAERAKNPLISPEEAYARALDKFFQSEKFPGSDTRFSTFKRMDEASRQ